MEIQAQHDVKKTPAKMLPSTLSKHSNPNPKHFCFNIKPWQANLKLENKKLNISGYTVKLPVHVLTIK